MSSIDPIQLEKDKQIIISKMLLTDEECDELVDLFDRSDKSDIDTLGCRRLVKTIIPEHIINKIHKLLSNYVLIKKVEYEGVIYHTVGGEIKEHTDRILYDPEIDSFSKYTLIIYLTDTEQNSGLTRIKRDKIYSFENNDDKLKHERHAIQPIKGGCVLFNSCLFHNATESYGDKYILVTKVY